MTTEAPRHPLPPFTRETAIEKVRLAEDGWDVGAAMELVDGSWTATVDVGWAADTEYRFRIDGSADWIVDPANEDTENDNSVVRATMCELYTCP